MSIVQLSRFLSFFSCDSFDILSNLFRFVKNFFYFSVSLICFPLGPLQATACIGYHICKALSTVFSSVFSTLPAPFFPLSCPRLFRLRVSGWPDLLRLFKAPSSATDAILSPREAIVNVFSLFYLFQTIHTIPVNIPILFLFYSISIRISSLYRISNLSGPALFSRNIYGRETWHTAVLFSMV